jgi:hypothetical protein
MSSEDDKLSQIYMLAAYMQQAEEYLVLSCVWQYLYLFLI